MKKTHLLLIIVTMFCFFSCLFLSGCNTPSKAQTAAFTDGAVRGNSDGNLNNMGLSAASDGEVYFVGSENNYDIVYRANDKGKTEEAILGITGYIRFLNIVGDRFYFVGITYDSNGNASESIFRADLDGAEKSCLFSIDPNLTVVYMTVAGDTALYAASAAEGESKVCALNLDDGSETTLFTTESAIQSLNLRDGALYYISNNAICRRTLNGNSGEILYTAKIWLGNMVLGGDRLYFVETEKDKTDSIKSVKLDGSDEKTLLTDAHWIHYMNIRNETLYYADHTYDNDDHLENAVFYAVDIPSGKAVKLGAAKSDYAGFDLCGEVLIYHLQDDGFTAKFIPLP